LYPLTFREHLDFLWVRERSGNSLTAGNPVNNPCSTYFFSLISDYFIIMDQIIYNYVHVNILPADALAANPDRASAGIILTPDQMVFHLWHYTS